jgi:hypothetical protein
MSERSEFRTIECVGGPLDGFWEEDVVERFYAPIDPRFSPRANEKAGRLADVSRYPN